MILVRSSGTGWKAPGAAALAAALSLFLGLVATSASTVRAQEQSTPPVLSQIPYINRLFKNVGIGRDTRHIMIMVTPRIIISSEEEMAQAPPQ